jgi:hypothetical protein
MAITIANPNEFSLGTDAVSFPADEEFLNEDSFLDLLGDNDSSTGIKIQTTNYAHHFEFDDWPGTTAQYNSPESFYFEIDQPEFHKVVLSISYGYGSVIPIVTEISTSAATTHQVNVGGVGQIAFSAPFLVADYNSIWMRIESNTENYKISEIRMYVTTRDFGGKVAIGAIPDIPAGRVVVREGKVTI